MLTYIYLIGLSILMCKIIAVGLLYVYLYITDWFIFINGPNYSLLYVYLYIPDRLLYIDVPNYSSGTVVCVLIYT